MAGDVINTGPTTYQDAPSDSVVGRMLGEVISVTKRIAELDVLVIGHDVRMTRLEVRLDGIETHLEDQDAVLGTIRSDVGGLVNTHQESLALQKEMHSRADQALWMIPGVMMTMFFLVAGWTISHTLVAGTMIGLGVLGTVWVALVVMTCLWIIRRPAHRPRGT